MSSPGRTREELRVIIRHLSVAGLFLLLAVGLTYPLALEMTTAIPGTSRDKDVVTFVWNLWWMHHALLDLRVNPFQTQFVFAPFTVDLRLHTFAPLHGLVSLPIQQVLGPVGAFNSILFLTVVLNGYAVWLLGCRVLGRCDLAVLAGTLVALNPALTFHLRMGRPSFASVWPIALGLWFLIRLVESRRWRDGIGLGFSALAALTVDHQVFLFCGLWIGVYLARGLIQRPSALFDPRLASRALVGLAIVGIPFVTIFYPPLVEASSLGYDHPSGKETLEYSLRIWDFVDPPVLRSLLGILLPLGVLASILTLSRDRKHALWLCGGLFFLLLSLGVSLQPTGWPLPFAALRNLPGLGHFRTPYRFTVPATLGLAMAAGGVLAHWRERRVPGRFHSVLSMTVFGLAVLDGFTAEPQGEPFRLQKLPDLPAYRRIADEPGDFTVLEVPLGVRSGLDTFGHHETLQFYQMVHHKRLINGMIARVPRSVFDYYRDSPALSLLAGEPVPDGADLRTDLERRLGELQVGYVVIHPTLLEPAVLKRIEGLLEGFPELVPVGVDDGEPIRLLRCRKEPWIRQRLRGPGAVKSPSDLRIASPLPRPSRKPQGTSSKAFTCKGRIFAK